MLHDRRRNRSRLVAGCNSERRSRRDCGRNGSELQRCGRAAEEPAEELDNRCCRATPRACRRPGLLELLRDPAPGPEEQRFDGCDGDAELVRDLLVGVPLKLTEDQCPALPRGNGSQRLSQLAE